MTTALSSNDSGNGNFDDQPLSLVMDKLDRCSCLFVEYYQQLLEERELLDAAMSDGYLHMSKARSIMGCASLSINQVPNDTLVAKFTCDIVEEGTEEGEKEKKNDDDDDDLLLKFNKSLTFSLVENHLHKKNKKETTAGSETGTEYSPVISRNSSSSSSRMPTWFGVLTPQSLRSSHKSFTRSLYLIRSIAELQTKLKQLQVVYADLIEQKKKARKL